MCNEYEAYKRIEALGVPKLQVSLAGMYRAPQVVKTHTTEEKSTNKKGGNTPRVLCPYRIVITRSVPCNDDAVPANS